jgi:acetylornithine/succinyldiaminopimelate/putrescine aminotransferase
VRAAAILKGVSNAHPLVVACAEGSLIWDVDGHEYIDSGDAALLNRALAIFDTASGISIGRFLGF